MNEIVWVMHPEFGMVRFSSPTPRQRQVLEEYGRMFQMEHEVDHDRIVEDFVDEKEKESNKKKV